MSSSSATHNDPPSSPPLTEVSSEDKEQHVLPKNRVGIVFFGLMCTTFLAALDSTIVSTALPTIVAELGGGDSYGWVGSAYFLPSAALVLLYGKLSDILGRKPILCTCIVTFLIGSALCGAAQDMAWLIVGRVVQGMGEGGLILLAEIVISDIVPLKDRGNYAGVVTSVWGVAGVFGPLVGGALTQYASWRWCFWINLPIGGIAGAIVFFFLNLNTHRERTFHEHIKEFDFIGLLTAVSAGVCLLLGFNMGGNTWKSTGTISLLVVGGILLVVFAINEIYTRRSAIIPPRLFKTRTTGIILVSMFIQTFVVTTGAYYLPMYYQVMGASPAVSGVKMLPYSLGASIVAVPSGLLISYTGTYRPVLWGASAVMTVGWGLMTMLGNTSGIAAQEIYPLITVLGAGCLYDAPLIALQAAMPVKDMATSIGAAGFLCILAAAISVTIGEMVISSSLQPRLKAIPGITMNTSAASINENIKKIALIPDEALKAQVMHAYARSISTVWLVNMALSALGLVLVLFIRAYSLNREGVETTGSAEHSEDVKRTGDEARSVELA